MDTRLLRIKRRAGRDPFFNVVFEKTLSVTKEAIRKPPKRYKKIIFGNSNSSFVTLVRTKGVKNNSVDSSRKYGSFKNCLVDWVSRMVVIF
ncbi:hypothetical protein ACFL15_02370 [Patescibacteria group bacterium]